MEYIEESANLYFPEGHKHVIDFIHSLCALVFLKMERNWGVKVEKDFVHDEHAGAATGFLDY